MVDFGSYIYKNNITVFHEITCYILHAAKLSLVQKDAQPFLSKQSWWTNPLDKSICKVNKIMWEQTITWPFCFANFEQVFLPLRKWSIWGEMCPILNFCRKHFWPIRKFIWLDKNVFYWRIKAGLKDDFIMCYFLWGPWIVKIVNCFCPLVLSTCHNWELLITCPRRPLCFKKIRTTTTTAFLISNTVVLNPYSHRPAFNLQSLTFLS